MLECLTQLIRARGELGTATDSADTRDDIVDLLSANQLAYSLQVAIATAKEEHLLDYIVLISSNVDELRTGALSLILYVLSLHGLSSVCGLPDQSAALARTMWLLVA